MCGYCPQAPWKHCKLFLTCLAEVDRTAQFLLLHSLPSQFITFILYCRGPEASEYCMCLLLKLLRFIYTLILATRAVGSLGSVSPLIGCPLP